MKLIYLSHVRLPTEKAHGLQIMQMCEAFAKAKNNDRLQIEVELVVPNRKNKIKDNPFLYYDTEPVFKITRLSCWDWPWLGRGQVWYVVQMISFLVRAKLYLFQKKFDVLYTRTPAASLFFNQSVVECHDWPVKLTWQKLAFKRVRHFVVLTTFLKQRLISLGIPERRIIVAPDGVKLSQFTTANPDRLAARQSLGLPSSKKLIMYVGSFQRYNWKGLDILLTASLKLSPESLVVCVGGLAEEIVDLRNRYPAVLFIERQRHLKIPQYLAAADILILPNRRGDFNSEYYTSPLKLFEYMAAQRPIIASNLPSLREILNEENAILVESDNPEALVVAIERLQLEAEAGEKLAARAYQDVQRYDWSLRAEKILESIK